MGDAEPAAAAPLRCAPPHCCVLGPGDGFFCIAAMPPFVMFSVATRKCSCSRVTESVVVLQKGGVHDVRLQQDEVVVAFLHVLDGCDVMPS